MWRREKSCNQQQKSKNKKERIVKNKETPFPIFFVEENEMQGLRGDELTKPHAVVKK